MLPQRREIELNRRTKSDREIWEFDGTNRGISVYGRENAII